jgi:hypothetical protein
MPLLAPCSVFDARAVSEPGTDLLSVSTVLADFRWRCMLSAKSPFWCLRGHKKYDPIGAREKKRV